MYKIGSIIVRKNLKYDLSKYILYNKKLKEGKMKKYLLVSLCAFLFTASISYGQIVFAEDFNYTAGTLLSANGWTAVSSAGTNPITVSTPGLSLTNYYANSGGAVSLSGSGEDDNKTFTAQTSGSLYLSFLLKVTAATTGDYFIALSPATQTNYTARTFVKSKRIRRI